MDGLIYVHSHKFVHLDIKPENIFLCDEDIMKVGDFGLSCRSCALRIAIHGYVLKLNTAQ